MWWLLVLIAISSVLYIWFFRRFEYWKRKGVTSVVPKSLLQHYFIVRKKAPSEIFGDLYLNSPDERYVGVYQVGLPTLLLKDPDLIKRIAIREFDTFPDHRTFVPAELDPLWGKNLFASTGDNWRKLRPMVSPVFTSSKMRMIFVLMDECSRQFSKYFLDQKKDLIELEMKDICTRYANDVIATTAFGIKCDSLTNRENEFYAVGREATGVGVRSSFKFFLHSMSPFFGKLLSVRIFSKRVSSYFTAIIGDTIRVREEKKILRPDLIHILMERRKGGMMEEDEAISGSEGFSSTKESDLGKPKHSHQMNLTLTDIVAQALIFFLAGFDTVATSMCFFAYELMVNPDIQDRLLEEIDRVNEACDGNVTYEAILGMKYLDMVLSETLRKWPPTPVTDRKAARRFTIEPILPGEKPLTLEKGDMCMLPIFGIHRDPKYYPNPEVFDPERFNEENRKSIGVSTYIPFGIGPRNCIGSRFALLEVKLLFFHVLSNFRLVPTEKSQIPIVLDKTKFGLGGENGIHLAFKRRAAL